MSNSDKTHPDIFYLRPWFCSISRANVPRRWLGVMQAVAAGLSSGAGGGDLVAPFLGCWGNLPVDKWWKTKSSHWVNRMWLTLNSVMEFLWFSVTVASMGYWDWVWNKMSGRLKIRFHLKRYREFAEHKDLSLISAECQRSPHMLKFKIGQCNNIW